MARVYPHPDLVVPQTFVARKKPDAPYSRLVSSTAAFDAPAAEAEQLVEIGARAGGGRAFTNDLAPGTQGHWRYVAEVMADSPLLYWRFDDANKNNFELCTDSSGNANHGGYYLVADAAGNTSDGSRAVDYINPTGSNQIYHGTADASWLFATRASRTFECWIKRDQTTANEMLFTGNNTTSQAAMYSWVVGARDFGFAPNGTLGTITTWANALPVGGSLGVWTHLAVSYFNNATSGSASLYINGALVSTQANYDDWGPTNSNHRLGQWYYGPGNIAHTARWQGHIDEYAVYPTALSAARIAAHYAAR